MIHRYTIAIYTQEFSELPPLLFFDFENLTVRGEWPQEMVLRVNASASNYNMYKAAWEPYIEKWPMKFSVGS